MKILSDENVERLQVSELASLGARKVCFDFEGVLMDCRAWHWKALLRALEVLRLPSPEFKDAPCGSTRAFLKDFGERNGWSRGTILSSLSEKEVQLLKCAESEPMMVLPQIDMLFHQISSLFRICICSNAKAKFLKIALDRLNITSRLDFFLSSDDAKNPKPSPDIYLMASEKWGVDPSSMIIFEDSEIGICAAIESGAWTIPVTFHDLRPHSWLRLHAFRKIT